MSTLLTTTSTGRPSLGSSDTGALYYETDTNRLIFWDGTIWNVYNRDSLTQNTGGVDELHYPQGIYSDTTATYYISQSPMLHFDASHMNGVDKTEVYAHDAWPEYWNDRTQNNYQYKETTGSLDAVMDLNHSGTMSSNTNTLPCVRDNGTNYTPTGGAPTSISGDVTTFFVLQPNNSHSNGTQGYCSAGPYLSWYTDNSPNASQTYYHMKQKFSSNLRSAPEPSWTNTGEYQWSNWRLPVNPTTGPGLYIGRNSDLGNQVWRPDTRGNHVPMTTGKTTAAGDLQFIGSPNNYNQWIYEILFFDTALSIAEVNKVKSYLQNKHQGLNADFFPSGGTIDLTE
mgnify:CR=1 FL=1